MHKDQHCFTVSSGLVVGQCFQQGGGVLGNQISRLKPPPGAKFKKGGGLGGFLRGFFAARGYCPREGPPGPPNPPNEIHSVGHLRTVGSVGHLRTPHAIGFLRTPPPHWFSGKKRKGNPTRGVVIRQNRGHFRNLEHNLLKCCVTGAMMSGFQIISMIPMLRMELTAIVGEAQLTLIAQERNIRQVHQCSDLKANFGAGVVLREQQGRTIYEQNTTDLSRTQ